jgi:phosphoribosylanthranilate isomerase
MMVKICGITSREDALAAAEAGAAALGFNFYSKSPRCLTREVAASILAVLPAAVWKVGIFVNEPGERVAAVAGALGLDVVQLHGAAEPPAGLRVWKAVRVGAEFHSSQLEAFQAEAFLLDTASDELYGGTGKTFDWALARGAGRKVILAGGLDETNVREAIRAARPWGVDACSRLESSPGRKDHHKVARFITAALSESQS